MVVDGHFLEYTRTVLVLTLTVRKTIHVGGWVLESRMILPLCALILFLFLNHDAVFVNPYVKYAPFSNIILLALWLVHEGHVYHSSTSKVKYLLNSSAFETMDVSCQICELCVCIFLIWYNSSILHNILYM